MKLVFGTPVKVVWVDACGANTGWREPYTDGQEVTNVGVFVHTNKNGLCLAEGVATNDRDQVLNPSFIPRGMVRRIRRLR